MDEWIVIPNWHRFQHYKDRTPLWIKVYTELDSDPDWESLTVYQRGLMLMLWLGYARARGELSLSMVRRWVGPGFKMASINALNHAGFIELSASRPVPIRYQNASPEKNREEVEPLTPQEVGISSNDKPKINPRAAGTNPRALGTNPRAIANQDKEQAHLELLAQATHLAMTWNGTDSSLFDEALDELQQLLQSKLSFGERDDLWDKAFHRAP